MPSSQQNATFLAPAHVLCVQVATGRASRQDRRRQARELRAALRETPAYQDARGQKAVVDQVGEDGLAVAFFGAAELAVACATEVAGALMRRGETRVSAGVHGGPVRRAAELWNTRGVEGPGVALAHDVMACGDIGHVLVSETTAIRAMDAPEWADALSDLGPVEVQPGLPLRLFSLAHNDVGNRSVPTRVKQLSAARAALRRTHNLPPARTRLIGRDADASDIVDRLETSHFVALTGPPGVGKTRVALEVAERLKSRRPGGVWLVDLSAVSVASDVPSTIARALGLLALDSEPSLDRAELFLRDRDALLVLDGLPDVLASAGESVERMLDACPRLYIVATSPIPVGAREPWPVKGLPFLRPAADADAALLRDSPAVELFERRAYEADRGSRLTDEAFRVVADICVAVGGSPLAIELAAAASVHASVEEVLSGLRERMARGKHAGADTTPAVATWAVEAAAESDRTILQSLSVFHGEFAMSAAQAVCESDDTDAGQVAEAVGSLARRGLVGESDGPDRYRLAGAVKEHARALAELAGAADVLRCRYAKYLGACSRELLEAAGGDVERTLEWATEHDRELGFRIATNAAASWHDRGEWARCARWFDILCDRREGVTVDLLAAALTARSRARLELGDPNGALRDADDALAHSSSIDDREGVALARRAKGQALVSTGSVQEGMRHCEEALASLRRLERPEEAAVTAAELAAASMLAGDAAKAMAYAADGLRVDGGEEASSSLLLLRGIGAARSRDYAHAREALAEALVVHRSVGAERHEASNLLWQAELAGREGDHHAAALYHSERLYVVRLVGGRTEIAEALRSAGVSSRRGDRLGDARRFAREEGRLRAELNHPQEAARARLLLVDIEVAGGDAAVAREALTRALAHDVEDGERVLCLYALGTVAHLSELHDEAATLLGAAARWRDEDDLGDGDALERMYADAVTEARRGLRTVMEPDAYDRADAAGQTMTPEDAMAYGRARLSL